MFDSFKNSLENFTKGSFVSSSQNDKQAIGIAGYTLDVRLQEYVTYESDIPDNPVESGSAIHDHIIHKPLILKIDGEVADLHFKDFNDGFIIDAIVPDKTAGILENLYPTYRSNQAVQRVQKVADDIRYSKVAEVVNKTGNLYEAFNGGRDSETLNFLEFMERIHYAKIPVKIQTASKTYENMALMSYAPVRDQVTNEALGYQATFKQLTLVETILVEVQKLKKNPSPSMKNKTAETKDKGIVNGKKATAEETKKNKTYLGHIVDGVKAIF